MAAANDLKQSFSLMLFTSAQDGKPLQFHMTPCPQKKVLQPLIEVAD